VLNTGLSEVPDWVNFRIAYNTTMLEKLITMNTKLLEKSDCLDHQFSGISDSLKYQIATNTRSPQIPQQFKIRDISNTLIF